VILLNFLTKKKNIIVAVPYPTPSPAQPGGRLHLPGGGGPRPRLVRAPTPSPAQPGGRLHLQGGGGPRPRQVRAPTPSPAQPGGRLHLHGSGALQPCLVRALHPLLHNQGVVSTFTRAAAFNLAWFGPCTLSFTARGVAFTFTGAAVFSHAWFGPCTTVSCAAKGSSSPSRERRSAAAPGSGPIRTPKPSPIRLRAVVQDQADGKCDTL